MQICKANDYLTGSLLAHVPEMNTDRLSCSTLSYYCSGFNHPPLPQATGYCKEGSICCISNTTVAYSETSLPQVTAKKCYRNFYNPAFHTLCHFALPAMSTPGKTPCDLHNNTAITARPSSGWPHILP